jgi:type II secretory pathway pseudopilin PulG
MHRSAALGPIAHPRGFVLAELGAVIVVVALTAVVALAMAAGSRRRAMADASGENLHRYASATTAYAADNEDLFWATSWRKGMDLPTDYQDLKGQNGSEATAATAQIIDILRRKGGRLDIQFINSWIPQIYYSHLPLFDYMDADLPALWAVSPGDRHRLDWAKDPEGFDQGEFLPCQPTPSQVNKRWPYSTSYQLSPSFWDQGEVGKRLAQAGNLDTYSFVPSGLETYAFATSLAGFPSQKVHLFEAAVYHTEEGSGPACDTPRPFIYPDARVAMLFVDGHTSWHKTGDANPGWRPNHPEDPDPTYISVDGGSYPGVYRWTRGGVAGRDYGGPEVGPP